MERDQNCCGFGCQCPQGIDLTKSIREHRIQSVHLLPLQCCHLAQMLSCHRQKQFCIRIQLFFTVCQMYHRQNSKHHPLVSGCQIIQHFFRLFPLQLHIIWDDSGKVIVCVLSSLPVGHICFHPKQTVLDFPYRLIRRDWQDVDGQHQIPAEVTQLRDHVIFHITGIVLHIQNPSVPVPDPEMVPFKLH